MRGLPSAVSLMNELVSGLAIPFPRIDMKTAVNTACSSHHLHGRCNSRRSDKSRHVPVGPGLTREGQGKPSNVDMCVNNIQPGMRIFLQARLGAIVSLQSREFEVRDCKREQAQARRPLDGTRSGDPDHSK